MSSQKMTRLTGLSRQPLLALPLATAVLVGGVFAAASTLTPVLLMVLLSGVLSGKIAAEIPRQLQWFRLASYVLLTLFSAGDLLNLV